MGALGILSLAGVGAAEPAVSIPAREPLVLRINCGADLVEPGWEFVDEAGRVWLCDRPWTPGAAWGVEGGEGAMRERSALGPGAASLPGIYLAERSGPASYRFALPDGSYTVRLHFAETADPKAGPGDRVFDVAVGDTVVLPALDLLKEAGGFARPVVREFKGLRPTGGVLEVATRAGTGTPVINGIEITGEQPLAQPFVVDAEVPAGATPLPAPPGPALYRVNCGAMLPAGYRYRTADGVWSPDREFKDGDDWGAVGGGGVQRVAPIRFAGSPTPGVYRYEHFGPQEYRFRVAEGACTLRLHFAETFESIFRPGQRVFDVTVGGKPVLSDFDPFAEGGNFAVPVVMEVTDQHSAGGWLTIGFVPKVQSTAICGIEVFQGSQAGAPPVRKLTKSVQKPDIGQLKPGDQPKKVLFIGNSFIFFWVMPESIAVMVNSGQDAVKLEPHQYLSGGKTLQWFWEGDPARGAQREIENGHYDYVVLQEYGPTLDYVEKFGDLINKNGARVVIHWSLPLGGLDDARTRQLLGISRRLNAVFIPIKLAWDAAARERPDLLWGNPDHVHPGVHAAYLAACLHYIAWTGKSPERHPYPYLIDRGLRIDDDTAQWIEAFAWRFYQGFKRDYGM